MSIGTNHAFYKRIGKRIKEARKIKGMNQEELAIKMKMSRAAIANIEAGRQSLYLHQADKLNSILSLSITTLGYVKEEDYQFALNLERKTVKRLRKLAVQMLNG